MKADSKDDSICETTANGFGCGNKSNAVSGFVIDNFLCSAYEYRKTESEKEENAYIHAIFHIKNFGAKVGKNFDFHAKKQVKNLRI